MFFINLVKRSILIPSTAITRVAISGTNIEDYEYGIYVHVIGRDYGYQVHVAKTGKEADAAFEKFMQALHRYAKKEAAFPHDGTSLIMSVESEDGNLLIYDEDSEDTIKSTEKKNLSSTKWKPKIGDVYYRAEVSGPSKHPWCEHLQNLIDYAAGNCFRTPREAREGKEELTSRLENIYKSQDEK